LEKIEQSFNKSFTFVQNLKSMENLSAAHQALAETLAAVEQLFKLVDNEKINYKPTEKWSFGEEMVHLTLSTNGTAMLLSSPEERLIPSDHPSRTYEEIGAEYREKLALNPTIGQTIADKEAKIYTLEGLQANFAAATQAALQALSNWEEAKSDIWMVWKHPLLGKMNAREMVYFTVYHSRHHLSTLTAKAN
jgi:hypothetical protein